MFTPIIAAAALLQQPTPDLSPPHPGCTLVWQPVSGD